MFQRIIRPSRSNSFFIFGARGTGKSTFVSRQFLASSKDTWALDLLDPELEDRFSRVPSSLVEEYRRLPKKPEWIFIDEIQKVPKLLNLVHKMIEGNSQKFILTGSSARKLKRGAANLLAGRAFVYSMFPLTHVELKAAFDLNPYLQWGGLPKIFGLREPSDRKQYLKSYALTYLKEEIKEEQVLRRLDPFRDFLQVAAQCSGKVVNFSNIARDVGVDYKTVQNYYSVLEDTLIGFFLPSFHTSIRKSQLVSPKFYFFDLGVKNQLAESLDSVPSAGTSYYGECFEHFIVTETFRLNHYSGQDFGMSTFYTKSGAEIDLVLSKARQNILVEIKSTDSIDRIEVRSLAALAKDFPKVTKSYYVSRDPRPLLLEGVHCVPWQTFFSEVFGAGGPIR